MPRSRLIDRYSIFNVPMAVSTDVSGKIFHQPQNCTFLMGFDEAMGLAQPYREKLYFPKVPYSDIVKGVDRFYEEPENLTFPVSDRLQIFTLKVNGATQSEIEVKLREFRRDIKLAEDLLKQK